MGWNDGFDNLLPDILPDLFHGYIGPVLGRNHYGVDPDRPPLLVLDGNLALAVGPEVGQFPVFPDLGQAAAEFMGQGNGHGHELRGFVTGKAEHHPLIAGSDFLQGVGCPLLCLQGLVHAQGNVRRLFIDGGDDGTGVAVEAEFGPGIADFLDGLADDLGNIHIALGGDLPHHQNQPCADGCFTGNPGFWVLGQDGI